MKKFTNAFYTIFSRVIIFNIILVILVTVVPEIVFINYFKMTYEKEIKKYNMQTVKQIQKSVDETILSKVVDIPNTYMSELQSNSDLTYPLGNDISNQPLKIVNVSARLMDIKNTMDFIDSIDLFYTKGSVLFTGSSVQFLGDSSNVNLKGIEWLKNFRSSDMNIQWIPSVEINDGVSRNVAVYIRSIPFFTSNENRQAIIAINIREQILKNFITNVENDGTDIIIVNREGNVVTTSNKETEVLSGSNDSFFKKVSESLNEGMFESKVNGKYYVSSFSKSMYNDWKFVSIASVDKFYKKSQQMRNFLIILAFILVAINLIASLVFTKRAYKPFGKIVNTVTQISNTFFGGENHVENSEYNLLDNTIHNLAFKVDDLNRKLEINKPIIQHNVILKLISGKLKAHEISANTDLTEIKLDKEWFVCFVLKVCGDKKLSFESEMLIKYNSIEIMESDHPNYNIYSVIDENEHIAGIINFNKITDFHGIIENLTAKLESLLISKYVLCFGKSYFIKDSDISQSYMEACECLKYTFIKESCNIIDYTALSLDMRKDSENTSRILEKIEDCIRCGDEAKVKFYIGGIVESFIIGNYNIEYCKNTLMDVVIIIRKSVNSMGFSLDDMLGYDVRETCKTIETITDYREWVYKVLEIIISKLNEKRQNINQDLEIKAKEYIEKNIFNDISLETAADSLKISASNLSKSFKALTGVNFSDYVTDLKLQHALVLLKQNKLSVKEISTKLGYNSSHHFIRIFKEKYGSTPKEYQKTLL